MNRITSRLAAIILLLLPFNVFAQGEAPSQQPNILIILADDLGYAVLNSYGGSPERVATPNIDRIGTEGAKFTDAYVTSSVCGPSRAALMTGRYAQRFGIYANCDTQGKAPGVPADQTMMPRYFKNAGYATAMIGKWHLGSKLPGQHPLEKGFDEYFGFDLSQTDYNQSPILFDGRQPVEKHRYLTREFTDRAIQFIDNSKDKPFFLYLAYNAVHGPDQAPQETLKRFKHLPAREKMQAAMTAELDTGVGRLLKSLEKSGRAKNTLIFFLSDNGGLKHWWEGSNGNLRGFKRHGYDGGHKVPLLVRWPAAIPPGQVRKQPVISLDILPTALDAAGLTAPKTEILDGMSLLPALKSNKDSLPERTLFWAGSHFEKEVQKGLNKHDNPPPAWAVRRGAWKLVQVFEHGPPQLFNIASDPAEQQNQLAKQPQIAAELRQAFVDWFPVCGKPIAWNEAHFQKLKDLR